MVDGPQNPLSTTNFLEDLFGLHGRTAVVTGGTSGLGAVAAEGLARAGAGIVVVGRDVRRGEEVVRRIETAGGSAEMRRADVACPDEVERLAAVVHEAHPKIDILVNAAGIDAGAVPTLELRLGDWQRVFDVNVTGTLKVCQCFGQRMLERGEGRIVNFASTDGLVGVPQAVAYAASKGAVIQLTKSLAAEWIKHGVRVNAVAPTEFETPMVASLVGRREYQEWVQRAIPIGRIGQPPELLGALLFLVSDSASMVVGHTLIVDGGRTAI